MAEHVDILGQKYEVVRSKLPKNLHGDCSDEKFKIRINTTQPPEMQQQTLFHELIHAVLFQSGFHYTLLEKGISEEHLVRVLEHGLWRAGVTLQKVT